MEKGFPWGIIGTKTHYNFLKQEYGKSSLDLSAGKKYFEANLAGRLHHFMVNSSPNAPDIFFWSGRYYSWEQMSKNQKHIPYRFDQILIENPDDVTLLAEAHGKNIKPLKVNRNE